MARKFSTKGLSLYAKVATEATENLAASEIGPSESAGGESTEVNGGRHKRDRAPGFFCLDCRDDTA